MPQFTKDYIEFYKRPRGYHARSLGSNGGFAVQAIGALLNMHLMDFAAEIRTPVLLVHGSEAHSLYFSKDAYAAMINGNKFTDNKELMIIPDAVHTDLYDNMDVIPFDKMEDFFNEFLK